MVRVTWIVTAPSAPVVVAVGCADAELVGLELVALAEGEALGTVGVGVGTTADSGRAAPK